MAIRLKNTKDQALAQVANYLAAGRLTTISSQGRPEAQFTARHTGNTGFWVFSFERTSGPTLTDYSIKLGPGEPYTERNPPIGEVWGLATSDADGPLSWYTGWKQ